jgi:hypothetical protein
MKRLPTPLLLAGSLLLGAATASAQTTFLIGVRGGANRALTTLDGARINSGFYSATGDKSPIYAWQAGVALEIAFGKFALQPAILFSQKGEKFSTFETYGDPGFGVNTIERTSVNRYNWMELPLNFVYTLHGDHGLQVFAGPYVALAVGGRQRGTTHPYYGPAVDGIPFDFDNQVSYGPDTNNRRIDAGVNFGVGYRQGPVQVQLGYGLGLLNLHQPSTNILLGAFYHDFNVDAAYNRVAQLTGTYFFSL